MNIHLQSLFILIMPGRITMFVHLLCSLGCCFNHRTEQNRTTPLLTLVTYTKRRVNNAYNISTLSDMAIQLSAYSINLTKSFTYIGKLRKFGIHVCCR